MATPTYIALASTKLSANSATVTFSNIPSTYRDLVAVINAGGTSTAQVRVRYNGNTGSNYTGVRMTGSGSAASSGSATETSLRLSTSLATAIETNVILQILDYSATDKNKHSVSRHNSAGSNVDASAGRWASNDAISSVQFLLSTGDYLSGSTFELYGIAS